MPIYHALSLKQPWANLIRDGHKTIETRSWQTNYRGELLLCSSKQPAIAPAGMAIALVTIVNCRLMATGDWHHACIDPTGQRLRMTTAAAALLDIEPVVLPPRAKTFGWHLEQIRPVEPVPVTGTLGVFQIELPELRVLAL
jgi:hypothetical protein